MPSKALRMFQGGVYINVSRPETPHHPISNLSSTQKDSPQLKAGDKRCLSTSPRWHLTAFSTYVSPLWILSGQLLPQSLSRSCRNLYDNSCKMKAPCYHPGQSCCFKPRKRQSNLAVHCGELTNIFEVEVI